MSAPSDTAPARADLDVATFNDPSCFDALHVEWTELQQRALDDNIFLTDYWQHVWWEELAHGADLLLMTFRDAGRLVGIAPTYSEEIEGWRVVRFGGGTEITDYLGFLVEPGYEDALGDAFLEQVLAHSDLALDFHFLRSDGVTLATLKRAAARRELGFLEEQEDVSPRIALPADWDTYVASLSKKNRHELRRKRRRLEEAGGWTVQETSQATLAADLDVFFTLHAGSTRAKADFLTPDVKSFFGHIATHLEAQGWLSLRTLVVDGRPLAAVLGFKYRGKLLLYNSGYDPEYNQLSPGFVLMTEEVRLAIEDGMSEVDFLRGNEKYKYDLGAVDLPLIHLTLAAS